MATWRVGRPCVECGRPAVIALLCTLRVRRRELRPTRVPMCSWCRRTVLEGLELREGPRGARRG